MSRAERTAAIRAAILVRSGGKCEACRVSLGEAGEMDHVFGRAKARQSVENCWMLCRRCHRQKTDNSPSAINWLRRFYVHARAWGYAAECERAATKANTLKAKGLAGPVGRAA